MDSVLPYCVPDIGVIGFALTATRGSLTEGRVQSWGKGHRRRGSWTWGISMAVGRVPAGSSADTGASSLNWRQRLGSVVAASLWTTTRLPSPTWTSFGPPDQDGHRRFFNMTITNIGRGVLDG